MKIVKIQSSLFAYKQFIFFILCEISTNINYFYQIISTFEDFRNAFFFGHSQSEGTKNLFVNNSGKHKVNKLSDDELHFGMDCVGLLTRVAFIYMPAMIGTYNQVPEFQNLILKLAIS